MESISGQFVTPWPLTTVQLLDNDIQDKAHETEWRKIQKSHMQNS